MRNLGRYGAAAISLLLHGGALAVFLPHFDHAPATAAHVGVDGIEVSFGPAGGAPGTPEPSPPPEPASTPPEPDPEPEPKPETSTPNEVAPLPVEAPAPVAPLPPPKAKPRPKPIEKIAALPPPPEPVTTAEHPPEPKPRERESVAGTAGQAGTANQSGTGNSTSRSGGGNPGAVADYVSRLHAWLERHKRYPREARAQHQEGTALLYFSIDRAGRVLSYRLHRSSGYGSIDRETLAMIRRADPLPAIPSEMARGTLEIVVPVTFELR